MAHRVLHRPHAATIPHERSASLTINSIDPRTGLTLTHDIEPTDQGQLDRVVEQARSAGSSLADLKPSERAQLMRSIADELDADPEVVAAADLETALGVPRLTGELARTSFQFRFFADVLDDGAYLGAVIDRQVPGPPPVGHPDLRRMLSPLGPVAVFGPSNFPLAFGVVGGDTASALAAGCPVITKAHSSHPRTSQIATNAIARAVKALGAPDGTHATVYGRDAGTALVTDPRIKAVGFTGSLSGGRRLFDLASNRPEPIPFFGELGSLNPVVVTRAAASQRADDIAAGYAASITGSGGQFCTKPGLLLLPSGPAGDQLLKAVKHAVERISGSWLLNSATLRDFQEYVAELSTSDEVDVLTMQSSVQEPGLWANPTVFVAPLNAADNNPSLLAECFGPSSVILRYDNDIALLSFLGSQAGSLTATLHMDEAVDEVVGTRILAAMRRFAGRVLVGGYPTGVAVTYSMTHGGPYPASTAAAHTSVGATAIRRFLRPITFQSVPDALLPAELRDGNPLRIPRRDSAGDQKMTSAKETL
ncbi:aldehyde dehydrogenase (NADP(+)) [Rhodococcus sp. WS3]|nr:aldehyde dehydrogenase (NADP(+)) [Rhodococcus sp. WS3]RZL21781.1 MAG: aldehyde dehydrogenase (NADP(+)) [Rhodococcus sp. (in: high G+C Gram-positive bacteria)]